MKDKREWEEGVVSHRTCILFFFIEQKTQIRRNLQNVLFGGVVWRILNKFSSQLLIIIF